MYLVLVVLLQGAWSYNVDVLSPYVVKGDQPGSFFGFSTSLHTYTGENKTYILIGAPRANWTSGEGVDLNSPGAVYSCPLEDDIGDPSGETTCSLQVSYLEDGNKANQPDEEKSNQWLGVNVRSSDEIVTACAHRYVWIRDDSRRFPIGKCVVIGGSLTSTGDDVKRKVLLPCKANSYINYESGSCQVGSSQYQYAKSNTEYLMYGAPGEDIWEGKAYLAVNLKNTELSKRIDEETTGPNDFNKYNGYDTMICAMSGSDQPIDFITSAPRANNYLGRLYFYNSDSKDTNERFLLKNSRIKDTISGDQVGAYFGYSMACGDLNNDGYDDLIVSAPWFSRLTTAKSSIISVGRIYVYNGDPKTVISNAKNPTIIDAPSASTSAFGLGLANIGDINADEFIDFAIGAPYENDYRGAVYIYHGSQNGIRKAPSQIIRPENLNNLGGNLRTFGWSISGGKDMDNNGYPDIAIGAYSSDRVVYLRSLPIVDLTVKIIIPGQPVDLSGSNVPRTTLAICFTPLLVSTESYNIEYKVYLDYKKFYSPRAYFQDSPGASKQFEKWGTKNVNLRSKSEQCTNTYDVYLNSGMFDKTYIEVNMTATIQASASFEGRAVLKQEQIDRAKGKIVIKSACDAVSGICQCDIELRKPIVQYYPLGYNSIVLEHVKMIVVKYEVVNLGSDNAHVPTLRLKLPPKVYFIRRTPVDGQTEKHVSQIMCTEIEEDKENFVECFLNDPLKVGSVEKFGISLSTQDLTDTTDIPLETEVYIGSPSEEGEDKKANNVQEIALSVGRQANLEIRGTPATPRNTIKADPTLLSNNAFLRDIKLEVRHTVSVLIEETANSESDDNGIQNIIVQLNWPMRDSQGNYLLYLSDVYVKENLMKGNFIVSTPLIDPDSYFGYNTVNKRYETADEPNVENVEIMTDNPLNTNCSVPDPGCETFNITITLLKAGSINMKRVEFEMRSIIWLPTIINKGDFNVTSTAQIISVGSNLVIPPGSFVEIKTQVTEEENRQKDVLWIIIGSVIGGLIILAVLIVALWKLGFFKRKVIPKDGVS